MAIMKKMVFKWCEHEGINAYYTRGDKTLMFDGWYNNNTHIEGHEVTLKEFLEGLGITIADVQEVLGGCDE